MSAYGANQLQQTVAILAGTIAITAILGIAYTRDDGKFESSIDAIAASWEIAIGLISILGLIGFIAILMNRQR